MYFSGWTSGALPIQKCYFLPKVKEIKLMRGGVHRCAAQAIAPIDAEIGQKAIYGLKLVKP